ncbi:hypothetical protein AXG93_948s1460 [Marchantia polymorpha subsp. ruderalis]|uniref:Uncharacterized protein n=1 Tax=Marchantia polymorpha subsp. ruderalis TaxID=1480154 RepID=A0A176VHU8_MARPO|nr:hypothetical protein AXG93_948s1460 [Marchantia polymorpha subsp. ruderalis]
MADDSVKENGVRTKSCRRGGSRSLYGRVGERGGLGDFCGRWGAGLPGFRAYRDRVIDAVRIFDEECAVVAWCEVQGSVETKCLVELVLHR